MPRIKAARVTRKRIFKYTTLIIVAILVCLIAGEIIVSFSIKALPTKGEQLNTGLINKLLFYLEYPEKAQEDGVVIDGDYVVDAVIPTKEYLDSRYDCSDFMTPTLTRLIYKYGDTLQTVSPQGYALIKETLLGFKYWMTEPGKDSMCFWSENHQILYAVAEYLVGNKFPDDIFVNDGASGKEHKKRAEKRINYWMEHRFYYGFSEFNSSNYMPFNLGPMANLIEFGDNRIMVERMKMVMDIALYDLATNMYKYVYMAPAGRAYAYNMGGEAGDRTRKFTDYIWKNNEDWSDNDHRMLLNFISMAEGQNGEGEKFYEVPGAILEIGRQTEKGIIKSSVGLNVSELGSKGYIGNSDEQIMMQFGMEAFTNPEVIRNTINYFADNDMLSNDFFNDFKYFNLTLLKKTNLARLISRRLNPMPNGIALQRANIYTYATADYQLATAQNYHPGSYGATQMLNYANFTPTAVAFTAHPARYSSPKNVSASPGYWAGFGRAPSEAQHENVRLSIYKLPKKSGFLELYDVPNFTHTYLPEAFFDEVIVDGRYAFARVGNAYLSLTGASKLEYVPFDINSAAALKNGLEEHPDCRFDLVQHGLNQYWVYDIGNAADESFVGFMARIKANTVKFDGKNNLEYHSGENVYNLSYNGIFAVNGTPQSLEYKRFESQYSTTERESDVISFSFGERRVVLDYVNAIRT